MGVESVEGAEGEGWRRGRWEVDGAGEVGEGEVLVVLLLRRKC